MFPTGSKYNEVFTENPKNGYASVSYTHLDVYKRQVLDDTIEFRFAMKPITR